MNTAMKIKTRYFVFALLLGLFLQVNAQEGGNAVAGQLQQGNSLADQIRTGDLDTVLALMENEGVDFYDEDTIIDFLKRLPANDAAVIAKVAEVITDALIESYPDVTAANVLAAVQEATRLLLASGVNPGAAKQGAIAAGLKTGTLTRSVLLNELNVGHENGRIDDTKLVSPI